MQEFEQEAETFPVRWKGRQTGPFSREVIEKKLHSGELSLLHEICFQEKWITLRRFLQVTAVAESAPPPPVPVSVESPESVPDASANNAIAPPGGLQIKWTNPPQAATDHLMLLRPAAVCARCRAPVSGPAQFCSNCGNKVAAQAARLSPDLQIPHQPPMFLYIPMWRFVFLSIMSWGAFGAYWIYKNWRYLKERDGLRIMPFWRGVFGIFWCYGLLKAIRDDRQANALERATFAASGLASGFIILSFLFQLGCFCFIPLHFGFIIPVQLYINCVNEKLEPQPRFTPWSIGQALCLVYGFITGCLFILGVLLSSLK